MEELQGKVALVTGGSKGIGRAIALAFGAQGIAVAPTGSYRDPPRQTAP